MAAVVPVVATTTMVVPALVLNEGDNAWMLTSTAFVLMMTPALAFFYGGLVDRKNVLNQLFLSFICMGIVFVQWVLFGFSFAFGPPISRGFGSFGDAALRFGQRLDEFYSPTYPLLTYAAYEGTFAIITPALISGFISHLNRETMIFDFFMFRGDCRSNESDSLYVVHLHLDNSLLRSDGPLGLGRKWLVEAFGNVGFCRGNGCSHSFRSFGLYGLINLGQTTRLSPTEKHRHQSSFHCSRHLSLVGRMDRIQWRISQWSQVIPFPSSSLSRCVSCF